MFHLSFGSKLEFCVSNRLMVARGFDYQIQWKLPMAQRCSENFTPGASEWNPFVQPTSRATEICCHSSCGTKNTAHLRHREKPPNWIHMAPWEEEFLFFKHKIAFQSLWTAFQRFRKPTTTSSQHRRKNYSPSIMCRLQKSEKRLNYF